MNYSPYQNVPTFSQRHGLQEVPGPPQLEVISTDAPKQFVGCALEAHPGGRNWENVRGRSRWSMAAGVLPTYTNSGWDSHLINTTQT